MAFILIVDADEAVSQRASDALIAAGHACGCVADAGQARALMHRCVPDLVLIDTGLTDVSLKRLLGELEAAWRDLPVIKLSAGDGKGKIVHGAQDCIRKPFDPRFLVWRVQHALEVHAARLRDDVSPLHRHGRTDGAGFSLDWSRLPSPVNSKRRA